MRPMNRVDDIPQWVRLACDRWGRQKRRIWAGGDWYRDHKGMKRLHVDGYANSFLGRVLREREGTGQGALTQHWAEVLWGDALDVQRNIGGMPIACFDCLHLRYVFDPEFGLSAAAKATLVDLPTRVYWEALQRAEWWLWSRLDKGIENRLSESAADTHRESAEKRLQLGLLTSRRPANPDNVPELSLRALKRPKLTLPRR
jgi:hypothetical protein